MSLSGTQNVAFSNTPTLTNPNSVSFVASPAFFLFSANTLPTGMVCNASTCFLSGTPTVIGTTTVQLRMSSLEGTYFSNFFRIVIAGGS